MFNLFSSPQSLPQFDSRLYDEKGFYQQFVKDLKTCKHEVIIESPYISTSRMKQLASVFSRLIANGVKVYVITRDPDKHIEEYALQAEQEIRWFESIGVQVIATTNNHHRKLAIIDRKILWEGSLNILSQTNSREIMRRIAGAYYAREMVEFLKLEKFL